MIAKKFRLSEREVKKVLRKAKPFFSHGIVVNSAKNTSNMSRFAVVIGWKSVRNNVVRVFFRRKFYDTMRDSALFTREIHSNATTYDYVFVIKKQNFLDYREKMSLTNFEKDLSFLIKKLS